jgi:hypothetical protein
MTGQERIDFTSNADLVIRAFVCERLGVEVPIMADTGGSSPKGGRWNGESLEFDS